MMIRWTGSGWTILTRTWVWWSRWFPSLQSKRRSRLGRWSQHRRRICSWTSVGRPGELGQRGRHTGRAARSTIRAPRSAACGRSPSTSRSSAGTGFSSQGTFVNRCSRCNADNLLLRTYEANICSGSCELGTPAEHPHGSLTQVGSSIAFLFVGSDRRTLSFQHNGCSELPQHQCKCLFHWTCDVLSDGRPSQHSWSMLLTPQDGAHQHALPRPGDQDDYHVDDDRVDDDYVVDDPSTCLTLTQICIHVDKSIWFLCCRTTTWYWASCQVWRCRSVDANSPISGQQRNFNISSFTLELNLSSSALKLLYINFLHSGWILWPTNGHQRASPLRVSVKKLQLHSSYSSTHNWALHNRIISWHIEQIDWLSNHLLLGNWSIIRSANWLITWLGISQFPIRSGTVEFDHEFHPSYPMSLFFVTALIMWDEYQTSALKCQHLRKFQMCFPLGPRLFRDIWGFLWDLQGFLDPLGILRDLWGFSGISTVSWGL